MRLSKLVQPYPLSQAVFAMLASMPAHLLKADGAAMLHACLDGVQAQLWVLQEARTFGGLGACKLQDGSGLSQGLQPVQGVERGAGGEGEGVKLGLVDEVAPADQLLAAAKRRALAIAEGRAPRVYSLTRTDK